MRKIILFIVLTSLLTLFLFSHVWAQSFAYIPKWFSNDVSVIDTSTNTVVATIDVDISPYGVAVNPEGTRVYVTNYGMLWGSLSVIDTSTNTVTETVDLGYLSFPIGVAVNPEGTRVYVANAGHSYSTVSVIDTSTNTVIATVPVGLGPFAVAVNPAGTRVYVANFYSGTVSVIDTSTNTVIATVPVGTTLRGIAVNPAGTRVYVSDSVALNPTNPVLVIDTSTNTVIESITVGNQPGCIAFNPAGTNAYVANSGSNTVSVIDTSTNTVIATVYVGGAPYAIGQFIQPAQVVDADGDGIPDDTDVCPQEDASGYDADNDGCIDTLEELVEIIDDLIYDGSIPEELQNPLVIKITNALDSIEKGNICAAIDKIESFRTHVEDQSCHKISCEDADFLISYATNITTQLLNSLPAGENCGP